MLAYVPITAPRGPLLARLRVRANGIKLLDALSPLSRTPVTAAQLCAAFATDSLPDAGAAACDLALQALRSAPAPTESSSTSRRAA